MRTKIARATSREPVSPVGKNDDDDELEGLYLQIPKSYKIALDFKIFWAVSWVNLNKDLI